MSETVSRVLEVHTPAQMHSLGVRLGRVLAAGDLVLLTGELGAGKTTLTRGIGEGLNVRGPITSPTFVLARTHPALESGPQLVHVDAYRLADSGELEDLGIDFARSVVVAEWGAGLVDADQVTLEVVLERPLGDGAEAAEPGADADWDPAEEPVTTRRLTITGPARRWVGTEFFTIPDSEEQP